MKDKGKRIGNLNLASKILDMEFATFERYWKENHSNTISAKAAAKKLGIKVPAKKEGGE